MVHIWMYLCMYPCEAKKITVTYFADDFDAHNLFMFFWDFY